MHQDIPRALARSSHQQRTKIILSAGQENNAPSYVDKLHIAVLSRRQLLAKYFEPVLFQDGPTFLLELKLNMWGWRIGKQIISLVYDDREKAHCLSSVLLFCFIIFPGISEFNSGCSSLFSFLQVDLFQGLNYLVQEMDSLCFRWLGISLVPYLLYLLHNKETSEKRN